MINLFSRFVTFHKYQTDRKICLFLAHFFIRESLSHTHICAISFAISIALCMYISVYYFICVGSNVKSIFILTPMWIQFSIWIYSFIHPTIQINQLFVFVVDFFCLYMVHQRNCLLANQLVHSFVRACTAQNVLI